MTVDKCKKYTVALEEDSDTGELVLPLPPELLKELGWHTGDTLIWDEKDDGSFILRK